MLVLVLVLVQVVCSEDLEVLPVLVQVAMPLVV